MLETYKRKFSRAIDDKDFVNSMSEYISELGICPDHLCQYCKDHPCKDYEGFYDIDECPCQLPNPKGLGRPLHRRSIVTCGCTGAIYCHRNTTLPIIFREYSRRFQVARFICALKGRRVLYALTRAN